MGLLLIGPNGFRIYLLSPHDPPSKVYNTADRFKSVWHRVYRIHRVYTAIGFIRVYNPDFGFSGL